MRTFSQISLVPVLLLVLLLGGCANDTGSSTDDTLDAPDLGPCGNGNIDPGELCDVDNVGTATCESEGFTMGGQLGCDFTCDNYDTTACNRLASCGNNMVENGERCDGTALDGETCESRGFARGLLACNQACSDFDTSGCFVASTCNDDVIEGAELCDGDQVGAETCQSQGFFGGMLRCNSACDGYDTTGCTNCGNGTRDPGEECEGTDLDGADCMSLSFDLGTLSCGDDCRYDATMCTFEGCGDGVRNGNEECDGTDLDMASCQSLSFDSGMLRCAGNCVFDTAACVTCGDNTAAGPEVCDGTDVRSETCATVDAMFDGGTLACQAGCDAFDTSLCTTCGDAAVEGLEECDGANLNMESCSSIGQGFTAGMLDCQMDCNFDVTGCTTCGNSVVESGEFCESTDLNGETCVTLYFDSGMLNCDSSCTDFDTTGCNKAATPRTGDLVISEIMQDPDAVVDTAGEWFELHNPSAGQTYSVNGCWIESTNSMGSTASWRIMGAPPLAPGDNVTFATESMTGPGFAADVLYSMINLENGADNLRIVCDPGGVRETVDEVAWDGGPTFPLAIGASMTLRTDRMDATANDDGYNWCIGRTIYNTVGTREDKGTPGAANDACAVIMFTEYVKGTSNNKAVEIGNRGTGAYDLGQCVVSRYSNGGTTPVSVATGGMLAVSDGYVLCHPSFGNLALCDQTNGFLNITGNDALSLACANQVLDVIGQIGADPGASGWTGSQLQCNPGDTPCATSADCGGNACVSTTVGTADRTLRRKCSVNSGDPDGSDAFDPTTEWDAWPTDTFAGLGVDCP